MNPGDVKAIAPSDFVIRDATPGDLATLVDFNKRLAAETEDKTLDDDVIRLGVASALADPGRLRYWVAEVVATGGVAGQAAVTREWSDWRNGWVWWFQSVYVTADHRRRGVFRALHFHVRDAARATPDVIGLRLYVEKSNLRAQKTYESLGMRHGGYEVYQDLWLGGGGAS